MENLNANHITESVLERLANTPDPRLKEITHVFRKDDPYLASDAVCGVRESLVTDWLQLADGSYQLDFDFVLNPV